MVVHGFTGTRYGRAVPIAARAIDLVCAGLRLVVLLLQRPLSGSRSGARWAGAFRFAGWVMRPLRRSVLAFAVGLLGTLLRTPDIQMPFSICSNNRPTIILFAFFVVVLGPLCEELAFRGFPDAAAGALVRRRRSASSPPARCSAACTRPEYSWSWRHVLLISSAGSSFGWVRYKTGSTAGLDHHACHL